MTKFFVQSYYFLVLAQKYWFRNKMQYTNDRQHTKLENRSYKSFPVPISISEIISTRKTLWCHQREKYVKISALVRLWERFCNTDSPPILFGDAQGLAKSAPYISLCTSGSCQNLGQSRATTHTYCPSTIIIGVDEDNCQLPSLDRATVTSGNRE